MPRFSDLVPKYKARMREIAIDTYVELASLVYEDTPVDTGQLQASWTPGINGFDFSNSGGSFPAKAQQMKLGDTLTLANAQPYVRVIEYTGHSLQAPNGMMWPNVARFESISNQAAA